MKLLLITSLACLFLVSAEKIEKNASLIDNLDISESSKNDPAESKSSEAQRKRDSGYSYVRPDKFLSSQRHELIRGRIVAKRPSGQSIRPFNHYGPPRYRHQPGGHRNRPNHQHDLHISIKDFTSGSSIGNTHQRVPSPIRDHEFVEPSPIASQNSEPFNSNAANYLPPRNQMLPGYSNPYVFGNQQQAGRVPDDNGNSQTTSHRNQHQSLSVNHESLHREPLSHHQQISDAAIFLSQNSQAISQLYDAPATNLNYEPIHATDGSTGIHQNPTNNFQSFNANEAVGSRGLEDNHEFRGNIPPYASGILDRETLHDIQSLEKDRLISQLQSALVNAHGKQEIDATSFRYAQNHENPDYVQTQSVLGSQGQLNPSIGPQLDRPNSFNLQRPYGSTSLGVGSLLPVTSSTTPGFSYGLPSTTPPTGGQTSSTIDTSTTISTATQRPHQTVSSEASSQTGSSIPAPGPSTTLQFPHYGGFVPSLIGTNYFANYPTYGSTNFIGSGSTSIDHVQSSSPTQFGIPIPTLPATQGPSTFPTNPSSVQKPESPFAQHPQGTPVHAIPVQPINPIPANHLHPTFPLVPAVTQIHPVQTPAATFAHPTYGVQQGVANPLLVKPIKAVYPLYYYPNVYQIQKPGLATVPWNYAPSYSQTRPTQAWK